MLDENEVIEHMCQYLIKNGYDIEQRLDTKQKGDDIIAVKKSTGERILIEAKGGTSSKVGSNRFGKSFDNSQVFDRVAKGLYTAISKLKVCSDQKIALAFPDTDIFRKYIKPIKSVVDNLAITLFLVENTGSVRKY